MIAAGLEMMVEKLATDGMAPCVINDALILAAQNAGLRHQAKHHGDTPMGRLAQAALRLTCPAPTRLVPEDWDPDDDLPDIVA